MTEEEVIDKLSYELTVLTNNPEYYQIYRNYLSMALSIGMEHFNHKKNYIGMVKIARKFVQLVKKKLIFFNVIF